jgi:hypothetical protein
MNFLCRLGWHRPAPTPRWHAGLYFTKCLRCGSDLVRLPRGRWTIPSDVLVLWQGPTAASATAPKAGDGPLPDDAAPAADERETAVAPAAVPDETPAAADAVRTAHTAQRGRAPPPPDFMEEAAEPTSKHAHGASEARRRGAASAPPKQPRSGERPSLLWLAAALAGAGLLAGAAIATLSVATLVVRTAAPAAPAPAPAPPARVATPPHPTVTSPPPAHAEGTVVTADLRGCARRRWRRRGRAAAGEQVRILEEDGHWVTLTRAGTPCWTLRTGRIQPGSGA